MSFSSPALFRMKAARVSIASLEATSPALCPPMPSQTAKRLVSGSTRKLSSFSLRRRPTSVWPYDSSMDPFRGGVRPREYGLCRGRSNVGEAVFASAAAHGFAHLADRALHAHEDRAGHDVVADVQLADLGQGRHRAHVLVGEAVAGLDGQAQLAAEPRRVQGLAQ